MAQQILTKSIKEQIITNALAKKNINKRKQELREARVAWAERVRIHSLGGPEAETELCKNLKRIEALLPKIPNSVRTDRIIRKDTSLYLSIAGYRLLIYFNGNYRGYEPGAPDHVEKITPYDFTLLADDPLATEFFELDEVLKKIKSDEEDIRQNVSAALNKVRNVKRLLEAWPEAKELLPASVPSAAPPPAIRRESLNEMIGLPSAE